MTTEQNDVCWCPQEFSHGIESISQCILYRNPQLPESVGILIAHFVIGDKWPYYVYIKRDDKIGVYETIHVYPHHLGKVLYSKCIEKGLQQFSAGTVLLNRQTCRKLLKNKSLFSQNVVNGTKFECTSSFKGKGRIIQMW
eukprot:819391_1